MEFTYYKTKDLNAFENDLKDLSLNNNYNFNKEVEVLDENDILKNANKINPGLLTGFNGHSKTISYYLTSHKGNYLVIIEETNYQGYIGLTIIFNKNTFKLRNKGLMGVLIGLSARTGGSLLLSLLGIEFMNFKYQRFMAIKGPLGKELEETIKMTLGEPVIIKV
ncbi:hypothetical protein BU666_11160 [Staphylococcus chromogenes]|uniref:hypothetical protein n=1 Tax=Staphylococcus chromogenes TaxID=46126 RepID=UPI000D1A83EF|nr:hypothetical protein [Staphylococcus chromogenes]PTF91814.1 hypothetical protein BU666_11160 [Staphylococcus chromogenes]